VSSQPTSVTRDELRAAIDDGSVTVVDAQPPARYAEHRLPGALSLVAEDPDARVQDLLTDRTAAIVVYSTDADCARGPALAERLRALGYTDVRTYPEGVEGWAAAGLPLDRPRGVELDLGQLAFSPTAALFEGHRRAGVDVSIFVVRLPPGGAVELHVHPYAETFLPLAGRGRWTRGDGVVELGPEQLLVVPPDTPHGFRNVGDAPLFVVSVHERGTLRQTWLGREPA
jgi:mannose-6-phosphate isomerase-like protein (cupin superfamily)